MLYKNKGRIVLKDVCLLFTVGKISSKPTGVVVTCCICEKCENRLKIGPVQGKNQSGTILGNYHHWTKGQQFELLPKSGATPKIGLFLSVLSSFDHIDT